MSAALAIQASIRMVCEDYATLQPSAGERPPRPCVMGESDCLANRDCYPSKTPAGLPAGESDYFATGDHWTEIECIVKGSSRSKATRALRASGSLAFRGFLRITSDPAAGSVRVTLSDSFILFSVLSVKSCSNFISPRLPGAQRLLQRNGRRLPFQSYSVFL